MGLGPIWSLRDGPAEAETDPVTVAPTNVVPQQTVTIATDDRLALIAKMGWAELKAAVAGCRACALCQTRKQAVLGVGASEADWLFVGEGPGAEEDERGEPFVGQAGKLLDAMLAAIDLKRGDNVYIGNSVKCRPPNNRTPEPGETASCWPFLQRQVELLKPKLIVALGRPAAQTLLQREVKISSARGRLFDYQGIPVVVTYHPAYLLRNLPDKARAWEDLCFMRRTMAELRG
jgi:DNA polymerase